MERVARRQILAVATLGAVVVAAASMLSPTRFGRAVAGVAASPVRFGALLVIAYLLRFLVAWPISVISVVVGFAFGPAGIPVALAGAVLTCLPPYLLATRIDTGPLGTLGDHGRRYFAATGDLRGVVVARLAPLPADPVSYTAGLADVSPGAYALGTALGELPWVTAAVLVGAGADRLVTHGVDADPSVVIAALALAALLLAGPLYRTLQNQGVVPTFRM